MGKRELLLIVGFVVAGALAYQLTAPPAAPGERSFSFGRIVDNIRREIRGNRASAQVTSTLTEKTDGVEEIRFRLRSGDVTVIGEDRADLSAELRVTSNGFDDTEAERLARGTTLHFDRGADTLVVTLTYPEGGRQRANVVVKLPSRMRIRLDQPAGRTEVSKVAEVELINSRGEAVLRDIAGRVIVNHAAGTLVVSSVGALKASTRSTDIKVDHVLRDATFTTRAGELKASQIAGATDVDANNTDVTLDAAQTSSGTLRITAVNGQVVITGLRVDSRIEGRNTEIDVTVDRAAPLAIYSDGDDPVSLTPPASGYQLDAVASSGHITLAGDDVPVTTNGAEQRASGKVRGGGAAITIRSSRGDIRLRRQKSPS
jgi:putative adhesin